MTQDQIEIIISLIHRITAVATHPQTPPKHWRDEIDQLKEELRATARSNA